MLAGAEGDKASKLLFPMALVRQVAGFIHKTLGKEEKGYFTAGRDPLFIDMNFQRNYDSI